MFLTFEMKRLSHLTKMEICVFFKKNGLMKLYKACNISENHKLEKACGTFIFFRSIFVISSQRCFPIIVCMLRNIAPLLSLNDILASWPLVKGTKNHFSNFSIEPYVVGTQKNRLNETVLLSSQNICYN